MHHQEAPPEQASLTKMPKSSHEFVGGGIVPVEGGVWLLQIVTWEVVMVVIWVIDSWMTCHCEFVCVHVCVCARVWMCVFCVCVRVCVLQSQINSINPNNSYHCIWGLQLMSFAVRSLDNSLPHPLSPPTVHSAFHVLVAKQWNKHTKLMCYSQESFLCTIKRLFPSISVLDTS